MIRQGQMESEVGEGGEGQGMKEGRSYHDTGAGLYGTEYTVKTARKEGN